MILTAFFRGGRQAGESYGVPPGNYWCSSGWKITALNTGTPHARFPDPSSFCLHSLPGRSQIQELALSTFHKGTPQVWVHLNAKSKTWCREFIWNVSRFNRSEGVGRIKEKRRKSQRESVFSRSLLWYQGLDSAGPPEKW